MKMILAFLLGFIGGGAVLTSFVMVVGIMVGFVDSTYGVAATVFLCGGILEEIALWLFFTGGPSAMMDSLNKSLTDDLRKQRW